jgi:uncharacterized membrane protein YraQ (UPF0718 family)
MIISICVIAAVLAGVTTYVVLRQGPSAVGRGALEAGRLSLEVLPNLVLGFLLAGMLLVALPRDAVAHWMGESAGLRGIAVGTLAGTLTPGGPFLQFPIIASLLKAGAGIGAVTAYIVAWGTLGVQRFLVWELPILGWRTALLRYAASLAGPFVAGLVAQAAAQVLANAAKAGG